MYCEQKKSIVKHLDFLLLDMLMLICSYSIANVIRNGWQMLTLNASFLTMTGVLLLILMLVAVLGNRYENILRRGYLIELKNVIIQNVFVLVIATTFMFVTKTQIRYSRLAFGYFFILNIMLTYMEHIVWKRIVRHNLISSKERAHLLIIGVYANMEKCIQKLQSERYKDYKITGVIVCDRRMKGKYIKNVPVVANGDEIFQYLKHDVVDEVFITMGGDKPEVRDLADDLLKMGITVHIDLAIEIGKGIMNNQIVQNICGFTVMTASIKTATIGQMLIKRSMDIVGGMIGLIFVAIFFVILAPIIYIQSPGPIFFTQERVGRNGRKFKMYKFRSMYMDAEERKKELMSQNKMTGLMFKMDNDPRIIPIGKWIRKWSIDEFPQFLNVLKGDMSLVGTRPPTLDEYEKYEKHHRVRMAIKPGLTGMWQVSGRSDITDFEEIVELDNEYITNWNLRLDLKIIMRTIGVVLKTKGSV